MAARIRTSALTVAAEDTPPGRVTTGPGRTRKLRKITMTREEDLFRIAKKLDKMVSRNNMDGALDLLRELKGFNMTLKLLQDTRIGMSVNGIRKHCTDEQAISLAKILIKNWKRLLETAQAQKEEKPHERKNGAECSAPTLSGNDCTPAKTTPVKEGYPAKTTPEKAGYPAKTTPEKEGYPAKTTPEKAGYPAKTTPEKEGYPAKTTPEKAGYPAKTTPEKAGYPAKTTPEKERDPAKTTLEKERYPTKTTAEKVRYPTKTTAEKERYPAKTTPEKEKDLAKTTPEKERYPAKTTPEKEKDLAKTTPEKERYPAKTTAEREKYPAKTVPEKVRYPTKTVPEKERYPAKTVPDKERASAKSLAEKEASHKRWCADSTLSPEPQRKLSCHHRKERRWGRRLLTPTLSSPPLPLHLHPPPPKRPAAELKKERKEAPDPNAPLPPLPLHLHPPPPPKHSAAEVQKERKNSTDGKPAKRPFVENKKDRLAERKEAPDPNAPLPPLPLHLHPPPPPPPKHSAAEVQKERKNSTDGKPAKRPFVENKKDRLAERKDSSDSRPGHISKRLSNDVKSERRESSQKASRLSPPKNRRDSASSPPAKKLCGDRRDSLGSKTPQLGPLQRKSSTDSYDRGSGKGKADTPTSPTSPLSPSFSPMGGPLPPHLLTGDSIRDKCIDMLSAALRTDDNFKDFGTNCDSMAAEIEDYILLALTIYQNLTHIYQEIKATDMKYKNRVRSRISNLKDPKNPGLRKNVLAGAIELQRIATMTAEEMASDELKQLRNVLTQEAIREHQMAKTGGTTTDLLQCGKCRKKNCTYNQVQTRSADEPMTTFVLCNECGNRWKFC
ncbi:hypothetical protein SKAU_G00331060 [Synaphobranchus kaupii]|uniref:Transcription elongation factor A protein 3 n=1 Tax=Synaphobranchus kaupii TaxID=118154 RepID=A0A9Q1IHJ8_SYNKA|nr:hypothetical protein SKAU_G00331060 [Synaphobranchus kaupii]